MATKCRLTEDSGMSFRLTGMKRLPYPVSSCDEFPHLWRKESVSVVGTCCDTMSAVTIPSTLCLWEGESRDRLIRTKKMHPGQSLLFELNLLLMLTGYCGVTLWERRITGLHVETKRLPTNGHLLW